MAQYEAYKFTDEQELIDTLVTDGFTLNGETPVAPIPMDSTIEKDGDSLSLHYNGVIVTNYPGTDETWAPIYSTEVLCISARAGSVQLPSNKKVGGTERKYYWDYVSHFAGEISP